jgi:hypothetical protein
MELEEVLRGFGLPAEPEGQHVRIRIEDPFEFVADVQITKAEIKDDKMVFLYIMPLRIGRAIVNILIRECDYVPPAEISGWIAFGALPDSYGTAFTIASFEPLPA